MLLGIVSIDKNLIAEKKLSKAKTFRKFQCWKSLSEEHILVDWSENRQNNWQGDELTNSFTTKIENLFKFNNFKLSFYFHATRKFSDSVHAPLKLLHSFDKSVFELDFYFVLLTAKHKSILDWVGEAKESGSSVSVTTFSWREIRDNSLFNKRASRQSISLSLPPPRAFSALIC